MKKIAFCLFLIFIPITLTSTKADTGIHIYSCTDDLLETFEYLYQNGKKSNYSFTYDTETPFALEAIILENEEFYYSYVNKPEIYSGQGIIYISFTDQGIETKSFPAKNLHNYPPNTKNKTEKNVMSSLAQNISYQRTDKSSLENKKNLLMSGETEVNSKKYTLEIYVYPIEQ